MMTSAMTVREVAEYLNVAPKLIYRLTKTGILPGFKVAGAWRFMRQDIDTWIEQQKQRSNSSGKGANYTVVSSRSIQSIEAKSE